MKRLLQLLVPLLALYLGSCTYSSIEDYYVEPVAGDSTQITLSTNLDPADTTFVHDSLEVTYTAELEGGALYYVMSNVEEWIIYDSLFDIDRDTLTGPYIITDTFEVPDNIPMDSGDYLLEIIFFYSTNTNSLADFYGAEYYQKSLEFAITLPGGN